MKVAIIEKVYIIMYYILTSLHVIMISTVELSSPGKSDCLNIRLVTGNGARIKNIKILVLPYHLPLAINVLIP